MIGGVSGVEIRADWSEVTMCSDAGGEKKQYLKMKRGSKERRVSAPRLKVVEDEGVCE